MHRAKATSSRRGLLCVVGHIAQSAPILDYLAPEAQVLRRQDQRSGPAGEQGRHAIEIALVATGTDKEYAR
jgi:hypothetical protein